MAEYDYIDEIVKDFRSNFRPNKMTFNLVATEMPPKFFIDELMNTSLVTMLFPDGKEMGMKNDYFGLLGPWEYDKIDLIWLRAWEWEFGQGGARELDICMSIGPNTQDLVLYAVEDKLPWSISRKIDAMAYAETGYEGHFHEHRYVDPNSQEIKDFLSLYNYALQAAVWPELENNEEQGMAQP